MLVCKPRLPKLVLVYVSLHSNQVLDGYGGGRGEMVWECGAVRTVLRKFQLTMLTSLITSVIAVRKAKNIDPHQIINMDQTMCCFDMPSKRTNTKKGAKTVRIKTTRAKKKGFTVALAAMTDGTKLPAVIIFKECGGVLGE